MTDSPLFHPFADLPGSKRELDDSDGEQLRFHRGNTDSGYAWLLLFAGSFPSAVAMYLACSLPPIHDLSWFSLFFRSAVYVTLTALLSLATFWISWNFLSTKPSFDPVGLCYWTFGMSMFFPATGLLFSRQSWWALIILVYLSTSAAFCLKALFPIEDVQTRARSKSIFNGTASDETNLGSTFLLALLFECSAVFALLGHIVFTSALLAISFFLLVWRFEFRSEMIRRQARDIDLLRRRILRQYLVAVLVTAVSLIPFLTGGSWIKEFSLLLGAGSERTELSVHKSKPAGIDGSDSFVGIVLLPHPTKKAEIVPPRSRAVTANLWTKSQPLVIPFDGLYWYFKAPNHDPGLRPHVVRGKATQANIHSTDRRPIMMEAHQSLGTPIERSCCREIQVAITNADTSPGRISLGVSLVNLTLPNSSPIKGKAETLGLQVIQSSEPQRFSIERAPVEEVMTFPIPVDGKFLQFDQIKVLFLPAPERSLGAPRVAIRSFRLVPR